MGEKGLGLGLGLEDFHGKEAGKSYSAENLHLWNKLEFINDVLKHSIVKICSSYMTANFENDISVFLCWVHCQCNYILLTIVMIIFLEIDEIKIRFND